VAFQLLFTPSANAELTRLAGDQGLADRLRAVQRALSRLQADPRHQSLSTHKHKGTACPHGSDLFEAYGVPATLFPPLPIGLSAAERACFDALLRFRWDPCDSNQFVQIVVSNRTREKRLFRATLWAEAKNPPKTL